MNQAHAPLQPKPPAAAQAGMRLRRRCACAATGEHCARCAGDRPASPPQETGKVHALSDPVVGALRAPGHPLGAATLDFMQPRFGRDLTGVRVHTGPEAERATSALSARAFTVGQNLVFASGKYRPDTERGRALIAHELAHTLQQGPAPMRLPPLLSSSPGDRAEREAATAASEVMSGVLQSPLTATGPMLHRGTGPDDPVVKPRSHGLTAAEWEKIRATRQFFELPPRPTAGAKSIVGVLIGPNGEEVRLKSGGGTDPEGGPSRGGIPRGKGEAFSSGAPTEKNIVTHVEGKAAAVMHQRKWTSATLLVEEVPCAVCDSPTGTPNISRALPPGSKLTVVDPGAAGQYTSFRAVPLGAPPATAEPAIKPPAGPKPFNEPPPVLKPGVLPEAAAPKAGGLPKLPETLKAPKVPAVPEAAGGGALRRTAGGKIGPQVLRGLGGVAAGLAVLAAAVVFELTVAPKLRALEQKLGKMIADMEEERRQRLTQQIQKRFEAYEAGRIGRIVRTCYLPMLRSVEAQGKVAYVNVELNVVFEDTSGRFQLFEETPPKSLFDLEVNDVTLGRVWVGDVGVEGSAGQLTRCDDCGAMGRSKSFIGNNPLWKQKTTFSFEAPKADEVAKEFAQEPDSGSCVSNMVCFIATACYGSAMAPQVEVLRRFRDARLLPHATGRALVRLYYFVSPPLAGWLYTHARARRLVRRHLVAPLARLVRRRGWDRPQGVRA